MSNPLHSVLINGVVFKDDKVLVAQRSWEERHAPGCWTIPGGKIEATEGDIFNIVEQTLAREVQEETGVVIDPNSAQLVTNNTFIRSDGTHVIALIFSCTYVSGTAKPLEDTIDIKWVTKNEVMAMDFPPNVKEYILTAYKRR